MERPDTHQKPLSKLLESEPAGMLVLHRHSLIPFFEQSLEKEKTGGTHAFPLWPADEVKRGRAYWAGILSYVVGVLEATGSFTTQQFSDSPITNVTTPKPFP